MISELTCFEIIYYFGIHDQLMRVQYLKTTNFFKRLKYGIIVTCDDEFNRFMHPKNTSNEQMEFHYHARCYISVVIRLRTIILIKFLFIGGLKSHKRPLNAIAPSFSLPFAFLCLNCILFRKGSNVKQRV